MLCRRNVSSTGVLLLIPKDGMTIEKVSLAVLAVLSVIGLAYFIATALEVLPIISAS